MGFFDYTGRTVVHGSDPGTPQIAADSVLNNTAGRIDPTAWDGAEDWEPPSRLRIAHLDAACVELYRYAGPAFGLLVDGEGYAVGVVGCSAAPDAREAVS